MEANIKLENTLVHVGGRKKLPTRNIINMDADENYTIITMNTGQKIIVATTLKKIEAKVTDFKNFVRVNKSTILNTDYARLHENTFILPDKRVVEFSRRKWKKFQIENY
ncbi:MULTISPECIES: LytTR family DNA-binding domain-containing protein [Emticicia]|uniref:LytTR family DNA-binding domain-containing protein n=1 Tax=Emticicia TaxID=312278 RepID=UPI0007D8A08B|nr:MULTISPECIES: LytTR family DNA-binding domain-containing protein [Emticicia]